MEDPFKTMPIGNLEAFQKKILEANTPENLVKVIKDEFPTFTTEVELEELGGHVPPVPYHERLDTLEHNVNELVKELNNLNNAFYGIRAPDAPEPPLWPQLRDYDENSGVAEVLKETFFTPSQEVLSGGRLIDAFDWDNDEVKLNDEQREKLMSDWRDKDEDVTDE